MEATNSAPCDGVLKAPVNRRRVGGVQKDKNTNSPPPDMPGRRKDWRDRIRADLAAQVEAGGTLFGIQPDGTWIARTRDGDRVIKRSDRDSA